MSLLQNLYASLALAPDGQLDSQITGWIKNKLKKYPDISNEQILKDFLFIIDYSARYALASNFVMKLLKIQLQNNNIEINAENCPWRNSSDPEQYFLNVIQDEFNE